MPTLTPDERRAVRVTLSALLAAPFAVAFAFTVLVQWRLTIAAPIASLVVGAGFWALLLAAHAGRFRDGFFVQLRNEIASAVMKVWRES